MVVQEGEDSDTIKYENKDLNILELGFGMPGLEVKRSKTNQKFALFWKKF